MASIDDKLHWTTVYSEKTLLALIGCLTMIAAGEQVWQMWEGRSVQLADLFMLFIFLLCCYTHTYTS